MQATSSSFDLTLSPTASSKHYSIKSDTRKVFQNAIISTLVASSGEDSCPYQDMSVKTEHAEWDQPDYLRLRIFIVATIDETKQDRYGSSTYDLREELDAYILDNFFGDVYLSTILDQSNDEIVQVVSYVHLQVSENQSRIYSQRTPNSFVLLAAAGFVVLLFVIDVAVRYLTADGCSRSPAIQLDDDEEEGDGIFRDAVVH